MNHLQNLKDSFFSFLQNTFDIPVKGLSGVFLNLNTSEQKQSFGDLTTNAALVLAKLCNEKPHIIAQTIINCYKNEFVERMDVAGPGFINITLTHAYWLLVAQEIYTDKEVFFTFADNAARQKISLEFVSANPTGPLHLGHGRGGIIGDVLGNVLSFLGHTVVKEFYINDAGAQIAKLGNSFKIRCQQILGIDVSLPEDAYHGTYLVQLAQSCVKTHGKTVLEKDDVFFAQYAKNHLLDALKQTLKDYGIQFDVWFSEKTLHDSGAIDHSIQTLKKNEATYEKDGALWFKSTQFGDDKDRVLRRANGELTYIAADIAYLQNKIERGFDHLIMILGQDHHSYVTRLKGILQALKHNSEMLDVILYQLVTLKEDGESVRMSKRAGTMVTLQDILQEVGTDVARFFYLNRKADAHLDFDIGLALKKTDENPVYYIQYAYVRIGSILQKATLEPALTHINQYDLIELNDAERLLIKKIVFLKELLEKIAQNYQTHTLTYYVLELAQMFHAYYAKNRIIEPAHALQSRARLVLITIIRDTLGICFKLLGISQPERM